VEKRKIEERDRDGGGRAWRLRRVRRCEQWSGAKRREQSMVWDRGRGMAEKEGDVE
jgi:hypothetical protein